MYKHTSVDERVNWFRHYANLDLRVSKFLDSIDWLRLVSLTLDYGQKDIEKICMQTFMLGLNRATEYGSSCPEVYFRMKTEDFLQVIAAYSPDSQGPAE